MTNLEQHPQSPFLSPFAALYLELIEGHITRAVYDRRRAELEESEIEARRRWA